MKMDRISIPKVRRNEPHMDTRDSNKKELSIKLKFTKEVENK